MSAKLSDWLLDGLDVNRIVYSGNNNNSISPLADTDSAAYGNYSNYSNLDD